VLVDDGKHLLGFADILCRLGFKSAPLSDGGKLAAGVDKEPGDENGLGNFTVLVGGGLEALAGSVRKAVEVEAIVPVGAADERKAMWAEAFKCVIEAALQVLIERLFGAGFVVVLNRFIQDAPVAGLFEVGAHADDQPVRIIVESTTDIVVAALGEGLVLVIGAACGQLRGGEIEDALAGARRNHVDEAEQVLI